MEDVTRLDSRTREVCVCVFVCAMPPPHAKLAAASKAKAEAQWLKPTAQPQLSWRRSRRKTHVRVHDGTPGTVADDTVEELIMGSPLLSHVGYVQEDIRSNLDRWTMLGGTLRQQLGFDETMTPAESKRIYHYYLPTAMWIEKQLKEHRNKWIDRGNEGPPPPLVLGVSAPQGCGKTTLVGQLERLFNSNGMATATVSIDDFYLTASEQVAVAEESKGNPLLQYRGNAGTHDLQLAMDTINKLKKLTNKDASCSLPRYDKSLNQGRGDRAPESEWPVIEGPLSLVLLEGWMLGFRPREEQAVEAVSPDLLPVNEALKSYVELDRLMDSWLVVKVGDPQWVFKWRLQAEKMMRDSGKPGLTDEEVADFVSRFIPAYEAYLTELYQQGPVGSTKENMLYIQIDQDRNVH